MSFILAFGFLILVVGGFIKLGLKIGDKQKKPKPIVCPRCKSVQTFNPEPCGNCGSIRTYIERQFSGGEPLIQKCPDCQTAAVVDTRCKNDGTDLRNLIGAGTTSKVLAGAQRANDFHNKIK